MKKTIYLLMIVLLVLSTHALQECKSPIQPSDVPCLAISTYNFDGGCTATTVKIFNETPELLEELTWQDYVDTGLCNVTFTHNKRGSYILNSSDGSTASIIVEGTKMEFFNLVLFLVLFLIAMGFIAFMHLFKEDTGSSITYGFFAMSILVILSAMIMFGYQVINIQGLVTPFDINNMIAIVCLVLGLYSAWFSTTLWRHKRDERDEIHDKDDFVVE